MIDLSYRMDGLDDVALLLRRIRLDAVQSAVGDAIDDMAREAADYPPERAGQRYVRTGTLGRGWTEGQTLFDLQGQTALEAVRVNSTPYGPSVQGREDQAKVHQGRWQTVEALMEAWEAHVAQRIEDALGRAIGA